MRHIISVLVSNQPGVLARVAGLFSARGFNIASLVVGETNDPAVSRMTIVVTGDDAILEQVRKQLSKLIDTIKVQDYSETESVTRGMLLVKIEALAEKRAEILALTQLVGAKVLHIGERRMIIESIGEESALRQLLVLLKPYGIVELLRTGQVAMAID